MHRLPVDGIEIDGLLQEAEGEHGTGTEQDDGIAHVGHGDAFPDAGGAQGFPGQEDFQQVAPVHLLRQPHQGDHRGEHFRLVRAGHAVVDAPRADGLGQVGRRFLRLGEDVRQDVQPPGGSPLQQLRPVETVLAAHPVAGQAAVLYPAVDALLRHRQQPGRFLDVDLHGVGEACPILSKLSRQTQNARAGETSAIDDAGCDDDLFAHE
jgi:hypothetical protein